VKSLTDSELLSEYVGSRSEAAFSEVVHRHVDLVYSAALRMVRDRHLAEDVTQATFAALAQNAAQLTQRAVLSGWLHRTAQNLACNTVRSEVRRRAREEEAAVMNELSDREPEAHWKEIAPHLDSALGELDETDRDALMLRYFERKSAHEMAQILGVSDEAAQKRVSRAAERLRGELARRGVTAGAAGLFAVISANAVQAAPATLAGAISTAAASAGAAIHSSTAIAATKTIAMTTLQKTLAAAALLAAVGTTLFQAHENLKMRREVQSVQQAQASLAAQVAQVRQERDEATNRLAAAREQIAQMKTAQNSNELLRLRGNVGSLRQQLASAQAKNNSSGFSKMMSDPAMREYINQAMEDLIKRRYGPLFKELNLTPEQVDQFVGLVHDNFKRGMQRMAALPQGVSEAQALRESDDDRESLKKQLSAVLGESGMARFNTYSRELPARTTVDLLNGQLGATKLTDEQQSRLFEVIKAEPFDLTHGITGDLDKAFFGPPNETEAYLGKIAESNQRIAQQASSFLTPEQLTTLNTVLTNGVTARLTQAAAFTQKH
jgi:RNA polymerase sigma factor (sigma-70 family)